MGSTNAQQDTQAAAVLLPPAATAPAAARRLLRQTCNNLGLSNRQVDNAALIAGILVVHRVRQTHTAIRFTVEANDDSVTVTVCDRSSRPPVGDGTERSEIGYGIAMLERLADAWGFRRLGSTGWQVWARLVDETEQPSPRLSLLSA